MTDTTTTPGAGRDELERRHPSLRIARESRERYEREHRGDFAELRTENARLRQALELIAKTYDIPDDEYVPGMLEIPEIIRAALAGRTAGAEGQP